jgi:hypothetical protein
MEIGNLVTWRGRAFYLRGIEPMSVPERHALLDDVETGERVTAPLHEVRDGPPDKDNRGLTEHH